MRLSKLLIAMLVSAPAHAGVENSKHNMSVSGPGKVRASGETEICIFCHVSHDREARRAMWGRPDSKQHYKPYQSTTLDAPVGQPDGASKLCLSCHDGTIAVGLTRKRGKLPMLGLGPSGLLPRGAANLGTDLTDDHPVSMKVPTDDITVRAPAGPRVKLDAAGKVQCTSCHDPHGGNQDPLVQKFLVEDNAYSGLCLNCHRLPYWSANPSAHQASEKSYPEVAGNHTPYRTVAEAGCESCHRPHSAAHGERNLKAEEEAVCLPCHSGQVASSDVIAELQKPYVHPIVGARASTHDASEGPTSERCPLPELVANTKRHVECVDCHDPHASYSRTAAAPLAGGALAGVWGIDRRGRKVDPVQYQYQVCFKCHGDSANNPAALRRGGIAGPDRDVPQPNLRLAFDPQGASAHPVIGPSRASGVQGLLGGLGVGSQIDCTDCHAGDGGGDAPHGSVYPYLLRRAYATEDYTAESPAAYALCYGCHDRDVLLGSTSRFPPHREHVVNFNAPCSACHSAHGIGLGAGDPSTHAHLINFDVRIVRPNASGVLRYESQGPGSGRCSLSCHGEDHAGLVYPAAP